MATHSIINLWHYDCNIKLFIQMVSELNKFMHDSNIIPCILCCSLIFIKKNCGLTSREPECVNKTISITSTRNCCWQHT